MLVILLDLLTLRRPIPLNYYKTFWSIFKVIEIKFNSKFWFRGYFLVQLQGSLKNFKDWYKTSKKVLLGALTALFKGLRTFQDSSQVFQRHMSSLEAHRA